MSKKEELVEKDQIEIIDLIHEMREYNILGYVELMEYIKKEFYTKNGKIKGIY